MATSSGARLPWQPLPEDDDETPEDSIKPRPGDFTSRLAKEQRPLHDSDDADEDWLRTYGRQSTGEYIWR
jgi:hypothetical protein